MSANIPATTKAAAFNEVHRPLTIVERPIEQPKEGHILVKVLACGICAGDMHVQHGHFGPLPRIPGHELIGDVVAVGPGEQRWKIGDRVGGGWHGGHCGNCAKCKEGDFGFCEVAEINGIKRDGGYAEYVDLRSESSVPIPKSADPAELAPLLCAGLTMYNSLRHIPLKPTSIVAVQGIGGLGHLGLQFSHAMKYKTVALSSSSSKRDVCLNKLGADVYLDGSKVDQGEELKKMGGADVIMCTAPSSDVINALVKGLKVDGVLLILAAPPTPLQINAIDLISRRLTVRGWAAGNQKDNEDTLKFALDNGVKCMIEKYKLEDAQKAYERMVSGKCEFRVVLTP